jgi:pimeloyl-ACP methyl ester carboxylesterase
MTAQRAGFARADDGMELYYRVVGSGPPMVCCNGVGVSTFFYKYIVEHFSDRYSVVLWDYRGHGRSSMPPEIDKADLSMRRNATDLATVLDASGIQGPAILLGHSMGCQVILEFASCYPDRVRALVPMFGTFARPLDTFYDWPHSRRVFRVVEAVAARAGKLGTRMLLPLYANPLAFAVGKASGMVDKHYADRVDVNKYMEHLVHMDARVFLRMVSQMADHDLTEQLPAIEAPTLIIAGEKDLFTPLHRSEAMNRLIRGSEMMVLAEGSHAAIVEHPETINRRIDRFLEERLSDQPSS